MNKNELKVPFFNKKRCQIGVVHLGVGNFHRAHQALYFNSYLNNTEDLQWGICGINLRSEERKNFNFIKERNGNYVLKTISTTGEIEFAEIHSILKLFDWSKNKNEAEDVLAQPNVEIVTMTVTESGYYINENNKLNLDLEIVKNNILKKEQSIIYAYLMSSLKKRMISIDKEITLLCCDNIRENGKMLELCLKKYIEESGEIDLLNWINRKVSFPSCMVDRITPRAPKNLKEEVYQKFKIDEKCSVMAEPFIQWVIEDNFIGKRPSLEKVGVEFVKNVIPYEEIKIRILNAGHVALAYFGVLRGHKTYDQAIKDKELEKYFFDVERKEIIPALGRNLPLNLSEYLKIIHDRFRNENIGDRLERLTMDGVGKFPIFIVPTIKKCFEIKIIPKNIIFSIASWYIFMIKINNREIKFNYIEPSWDWIKQFLNKDEDFIFCKELWGEIPHKYNDFSKILKKQIIDLKKIYLN